MAAYWPPAAGPCCRQRRKGTCSHLIALVMLHCIRSFKSVRAFQKACLLCDVTLYQLTTSIN